MTYTFKLSRRLARFRVAALFPAVLFSLSCGADEGSDGLGPSLDDPILSMDSELTTASTKGGKGKGRGRGKSGGQNLAVSPVSVTLEPDKVQRFTASLADGSTLAPSIEWSASGGTIDSTGRYTAGKVPGQYRVIARTADGLADTASATVVAEAPVLERVVLSPATVSVAAGQTQQFSALGRAGDGSTVAITPVYSARGGNISDDGLYTAGQTTGTYRVIVTDSASGKADTAAVTITAPSPTLQALVLTPASVSLVVGGTQQFTASGRMSDGSTVPITATFSATGGSITSSGLYTAGSAGGTFRVTATQSGGSLADTTSVTISTPPSSPSSGTTYFLADAESGTVVPPWESWGVYSQPGISLPPVSSNSRARSGLRSWKFEVTDPDAGTTGSALTTSNPQKSMGCSGGHYCTGYYSAWVYLDAGYTVPGWTDNFNFLAVSPRPDPIGHVGIGLVNGSLQLYWNMKNCQVGNYACPNVAGYQNRNGDYLMTSSSPAGIVEFPRQRWVHVAIYYKVARTNGQVKIWQDGVLIQDITAPSLNTQDGHQYFNSSEPHLMVGWGLYQGQRSEPVIRMYMDDIRISDFRPVP